MSYWAQIDANNTVTNVVVGDDSTPDRGESFIKSLGGTWVESSLDGSIRKNPAQIGGTYSPTDDAFIATQPYPSWIINSSSFQWEPPVPRPTSSPAGVAGYSWDESTKTWAEVPQPEGPWNAKP